MNRARRDGRSPDDPKGTPRLPRPERRRQLLAAARELFLTHGYAATTTKLIARAAGVSEVILYQHFSSKKSLYLELLQEARRATLERWQAEADRTADPQAGLTAIAELCFETDGETAQDLRFLHRAVMETDGEVIANVRGFYLEAEVLLARLLSAGQQTGVFRRSFDPRVGAWEMLRSALGYSLTYPLGIPLYQDPDHRQRAVECLLQCLLKTDV